MHSEPSEHAGGAYTIALDSLTEHQYLERAWIALGFAAGAGSAIAMLSRLDIWRDWFGNRSGFMFVEMFAFAFTTAGLSALAGRYAASASLREWRRARRAVAKDRAMTEQAAASGGGRTRVVGRITQVAPVVSVGGTICMAYEGTDDGGAPAREIQRGGGVFAVVARNGARVLVDARESRVLEGIEFDEEAHVPLGALVEVVGRMERVDVEPDESTGIASLGHYRRATGAPAIVGTADEPICVRVLRA